MKENNILYQIKSLEKIILRKLLTEREFRKELRTKPKPTPTQMEIIMYILEHKNKEIYQKDLEEVLNLRRATVSGVLQTMEKNGLIVRVTDTEDTRTKKIVLKDKTREIFERNRKRFDELEEILTQDIPEEKIKVFVEVIEMMKNNVEKESTKKTDRVHKKNT